ncbi:hypothetical protein Hdeb2414_s0011g00365961 [Helianthus debilis subsp. tardiflorus]
MFADFFEVCNLRLSLTVFMAEVLEWYKLHISQLSPFGMIRVRNFEYTFRAHGIEPTVGDFRWFYQLSVSMGFYSFRQRDHTPKMMVPLKGMTKWVTKFFNIKAVAITVKLQFRNVTDPIITENISVPRADTWIGSRTCGSLDAPLWRMFCLDFKGKVAAVACEGGEERFNGTIRDNFRLPERDALEVVLPQGKGIVVYFSLIVFKQVVPVEFLLMEWNAWDLGALGDPAAAGVPKHPVQKMGYKLFHKPKKPHEPVGVPPLVPEVAGITRTRLRKYDDYVVVSDTLDGLGVLGGAVAAGGSSVGAKPVDDKKRKGDAPIAGGQKGPKLRRTRITVIPKATLAVTTGGDKPKSPVAEQQSGSTVAGTGVEDQPSIQPGETELEFYYRTYAVDWGLDYHHPPWNVMQGDDISNDPSACSEILGGLGTPFETLWARGLPLENRINQLSSMLVGSAIMANAIMEDYKVLARGEEETTRLRAKAEAMVKAAREGAEQLKKDRAAFEKLKQTETWAATAGLKQVRSLAKLLSDERKGWREACARENEKVFRVR